MSVAKVAKQEKTAILLFDILILLEQYELWFQRFEGDLPNFVFSVEDTKRPKPEGAAVGVKKRRA
jgi:hypothetical protein